MKSIVEAYQNPNYINQSYNLQIPSLYRLAERNLAEETERKKIETFLLKTMKKNKELEQENSALKEKIQEQNEIINAQKKKLVTYDFIVKECTRKIIMESKEFYASIGNQNGVNIVEEILIFNENNANDNNYSIENAEANNGTLRFGKINTP